MAANEPIIQNVADEDFQYPLCPHCGAEIKGFKTMETGLAPWGERIRIYYCFTCNVVLGMHRITSDQS